MASIGHIAVGMAAARINDPARASWRSMAAWSALAMLPDADVIGFAIGVRYADPWGHRGAAHSLVLALAAAGAVAMAVPRSASSGSSRPRSFAIAAAVAASHGLLDTLTDGGLGVALLWPFDLTRYFAPWRPIPVAPVGLAFLSPYGLLVALTELALFAPLIAFAIGMRVRWPFVAGWAVAAWLAVSADPLRERVLGLALREDTQYAAGYSETAFRNIERAQSIAEVRASAGEPLEEVWLYFTPDESGEPAEGRMPLCPVVPIASGHVVRDPRTRESIAALCQKAGVRVGMPLNEVKDLLGSPAGMCWSYTRGRSGAYYRARVVCFQSGKVFDVMRRWERG